MISLLDREVLEGVLYYFLRVLFLRARDEPYYFFLELVSVLVSEHW